MRATNERTIIMGMDLKPCQPHKNAPRNNRGEVQWGRYNWWGWQQLCEFLHSHDVDLSEFAGSNDGARISAKTCKLVANTIRANIDKYTAIWSAATNEESESVAHRWETCGGYRQY